MSGASKQALRSSPRIAPLLAILAVQAGFIAIVYSIASISSAPGMFVPLDSFAQPGEAVTIGVRFEHKAAESASSSFAGARVTFIETAARAEGSETKPALQASAGRDGVASIAAKAPSNPGFQIFHARLDDPGRFALERPEEDVLLQVVPADTPILFVVAPQALIDESGESSHTGAAAGLQAMAKDRAIVYCATRKKDSPGRLRAWLTSHGFPLGPILTTRNAPEGTLRGLVASLNPGRWKGQLWGIAVHGRDASALASGGIRVILLGLAPVLEVDDRTVFLARDWIEARKKVESSR